VSLSKLWQAFDEARFGSERTLNLRASLPTPDEATRRADAWLRQQQLAQPGDVLVITGRGKGSHDGVSVVREAVIRLLHSLKRKGVVASHQEHTPGSFVVTLAPLHALLEAPHRQRDARRTPHPPPAPQPSSLEALQPQTRELLRDLAERALDHLGVHERGPFIEGEMLRQFGMLAAAIPEGADREKRLREAIGRAMGEYD
jgi:nucleotide-binding universal stress UspA family protein